MKVLSAVILTKDAASVLDDCLQSVAFCDEIVVIDAGSTDATFEIAKKHNAKVYKQLGGFFADQRNFGKEKASSRWILYIDADERVSDELRSSILRVVESIDVPFLAYKLRRQNFYLGSHAWPKIEELERLFLKDALIGWQGDLHESPQVKGDNIGKLEGLLFHYTHRDLTSMLEKTIEWSEIEARLRLEANHPPVVWWRFPRVMLMAFFDSFFKQGGYQLGTVGLIESLYQSFSIFITYARLWEMQQSKR